MIVLLVVVIVRGHRKLSDTCEMSFNGSTFGLYSEKRSVVKTATFYVCLYLPALPNDGTMVLFQDHVAEKYCRI